MANNVNGKLRDRLRLRRKPPISYFTLKIHIEYNDIGEILPKLQTYKETDEPGNFNHKVGKGTYTHN